MTTLTFSSTLFALLFLISMLHATYLLALGTIYIVTDAVKLTKMAYHRIKSRQQAPFSYPHWRFQQDQTR